MTITPTQILEKSAGIVITLTVKKRTDPAVPSSAVALDISSATLKEFHLVPKHKLGVAKKVTADFVTNGSNGQLKYTTTVSTFDSIGLWEIDVYLVMSGYTGYSTKATIEVLDAIEVA